MKARTASRQPASKSAPKRSPMLRAAPPSVALPASRAPRNPVALALGTRRASGAAGKHMRSRGAQRRAERVALQKALDGDARDR